MEYPNLESFLAKSYRDKLLRPYCGRMSKDNSRVVVDKQVEEALLLIGEEAPYAPRSIYKVSKLYESLARYAPEKSPRPRATESIRAGIALARSCFGRKAYQPTLEPLALSLDTVDLITSTMSSSAGLTAYGKKKSDAKEIALKRAHETLRKEKACEPCLAGARTQFNDKTRLVWMYPYSMTIIEGLLAYPLNRRFKDGGTPMTFAMKTGALGAKLRVNQGAYRYAYALDASAFDSSICAWFIHEAFNILRSWFDENRVVPDTDRTVREVFDEVERYFIFTPIVMPNSKIYWGKRHGVPSGSYFTQIVDSIVNCMICGAIGNEFRLGLSGGQILVLGDDSLFFSNRYVSLDAISQFAKAVLGITLHGAEKSAIYTQNQSVHYLGRDWRNGVPDLPKAEILKRMVYPERYREYPKDKVKRAKAVMLLILSYAAVYETAWEIANALYGSGMYIEDPEMIDMLAYGLTDIQLDPKWLSGLQRYRRTFFSQDYDLPLTTTGILFFL